MNKRELENIILPTSYELSRVQMTGTHYKFNAHEETQEIEPKYIDSFDFLGFRARHEDNIGFFKDKDFADCNGTAEKILRIITSQKYRSGPLHLLNLDAHKKDFIEKLAYFVDKGEPVHFMLPAFPFKIKNPLKSSRGDADLAEVASLCKFNEINLQIKKVYPAGAQFHIFHDGHLYYRHFLHSREDADRYFASLKRFARELGIEDVVKLKDAFEELQKFEDFSSLYEQSRKEMELLWSTGKDTNERILTIRKSSHDNINVSDIPAAVLLKISKSTDALMPEVQQIKQDIDKRADACAFEYMTVQYALEKLDFFNRSVPRGIRVTVHPKDGQIGIYLVKRTTFLLPWMGVGILKHDGEASVRYEVEVKGNPLFVPVIVKGESHPFYYEQK